MKKGEVLETGLMNYYGELVLHRGLDGEYFLTLHDWYGNNKKTVSKKFAKAMIKEFGNDFSR